MLEKRISDMRMKLKFLGFGKKEIDEMVKSNYGFKGLILFLPRYFEKEVNKAYNEIKALYDKNKKMKNNLFNDALKYNGNFN